MTKEIQEIFNQGATAFLDGKTRHSHGLPYERKNLNKIFAWTDGFGWAEDKDLEGLSSAQIKAEMGNL